MTPEVKKYTLPDIAQTIATENNMSVTAARECLNVVLRALISTVENLNDKDSITLTGLAKITAKAYAATVARNPATGEEVNVPARKRISIKTSTTLKEKVNRA